MGRYLEIARQVSRRAEEAEVSQNNFVAREREESPSRTPAPEARPTPPFPPAYTVRFVGPSPVILGPHGEDPLDFRRDPLTGAWRHDPGWWRGPAQAPEIYEARAPCPRCGGTRFWVTLCHSEVCATCYPPRPGDRVLGWITPKEVH